MSDTTFTTASAAAQTTSAQQQIRAAQPQKQDTSAKAARKSWRETFAIPAYSGLLEIV